MGKEKLNNRQKIFCKEYIVDFNGTQAALRAGYSKKTSREIAYENLTKPDIQEYISELIEKRCEKINITSEKVVREIACIAFVNPQNYFDENGNILDIKKMDEDIARSVQEISTEEIGDEIKIIRRKIKSHSKIQALDMLMKHTGGYEKDNDQKNNHIISDADLIAGLNKYANFLTEKGT